MELRDWLLGKHACFGAFSWVGRKSPAEAWGQCEHPEWMLWALAHTSIDIREVVRIGCDSALAVLHLTDDPRAKAAVDMAERWCAGEASSEDLRSAFDAAQDAVNETKSDAIRAAVRAVKSARAGARELHPVDREESARIDAAHYASAAGIYAWQAAANEVLGRPVPGSEGGHLRMMDNLERELADFIRWRVSPGRFEELVTGVGR
jgi:hypothetical protein